MSRTYVTAMVLAERNPKTGNVGPVWMEHFWPEEPCSPPPYVTEVFSKGCMRFDSMFEMSKWMFSYCAVITDLIVTDTGTR